MGVLNYCDLVLKWKWWTAMVWSSFVNANTTGYSISYGIFTLRPILLWAINLGTWTCPNNDLDQTQSNLSIWWCWLEQRIRAIKCANVLIISYIKQICMKIQICKWWTLVCFTRSAVIPASDEVIIMQQSHFSFFSASHYKTANNSAHKLLTLLWKLVHPLLNESVISRCDISRSMNKNISVAFHHKVHHTLINHVQQ